MRYSKLDDSQAFEDAIYKNVECSRKIVKDMAST